MRIRTSTPGNPAPARPFPLIHPYSRGGPTPPPAGTRYSSRAARISRNRRSRCTIFAIRCSCRHHVWERENGTGVGRRRREERRHGGFRFRPTRCGPANRLRLADVRRRGMGRVSKRPEGPGSRHCADVSLVTVRRRESFACLQQRLRASRGRMEATIESVPACSVRARETRRSRDSGLRGRR